MENKESNASRLLVTTVEIIGKLIPCENDPNGRYYIELPDGYRLIYDNGGYVGRYDPSMENPI